MKAEYGFLGIIILLVVGFRVSTTGTADGLEAILLILGGLFTGLSIARNTAEAEARLERSDTLFVITGPSGTVLVTRDEAEASTFPSYALAATPTHQYADGKWGRIYSPATKTEQVLKPSKT